MAHGSTSKVNHRHCVISATSPPHATLHRTCMQYNVGMHCKSTRQPHLTDIESSSTHLLWGKLISLKHGLSDGVDFQTDF